MTDINKLPENLPVPEDDGGSSHLIGTKIATIELRSTNGLNVDLGSIKGKVVIYCYPMTGRPDVPLPDGWDEIPGARGCTPQSCSYRDHYKEFQELGVEVYGLSTQTTAYQKEMVDRLSLPFNVLSDSQMELTQSINLPTFVVTGMVLLKRLTMVVEDSMIKSVHYPIFPSDSDPDWVLGYLENLST
jgi:peroxiredoxin